MPCRALSLNFPGMNSVGLGGVSEFSWNSLGLGIVPEFSWNEFPVSHPGRGSARSLQGEPDPFLWIQEKREKLKINSTNWGKRGEVREERAVKLVLQSLHTLLSSQLTKNVKLILLSS